MNQWVKEYVSHGEKNKINSFWESGHILINKLYRGILSER